MKRGFHPFEDEHQNWKVLVFLPSWQQQSTEGRKWLGLKTRNLSRPPDPMLVNNSVKDFRLLKIVESVARRYSASQLGDCKNITK
jgi:hypothetical protein